MSQTIAAEKKNASFVGILRQYMMLLILAVIIVFFQIVTDGKMLNPMNVSNVIFQNAYVVILACGMLLCILTGGNIDLSVGSVVAVVSACAGTFIISWKWNPYLSMLLCLLISIGIGMFQGFWIAYCRIPPFIMTLVGMLFFRGLTLRILNGMTLAPFPQGLLKFSTGFVFAGDPLGGLLGGADGAKLFGLRNVTCFATGVLLAAAYVAITFVGYSSRKRKGYSVEGFLGLLIRTLIVCAAIIALFYLLAGYRGVPTVLVTLGVILLVYSFLTTNTVMGRHLYALGGNEKAARLSGVKTKRMMFLAYTNMSFLAGVAALVFSARLNSAAPQTGSGFEMDAIAACFIGGASAYGGVGTIGGALVGGLIMGILNNGMSIMGLKTDTQQMIKPLVLLAAVALDVIPKQRVLDPLLDRIRLRKRVNVSA
ncbi:MAG: sugar ABC transporter permease [Oscillospiraceae bacterium]|nr:sugar ABC transporter permease [Oscillospiraceae bacterium]